MALVVPGEVWMQKALVRLGKDNMSRAEACLASKVVAEVLDKLKKHAVAQKLRRYDSRFQTASSWLLSVGFQYYENMPLTRASVSS